MTFFIDNLVFCVIAMVCGFLLEWKGSTRLALIGERILALGTSKRAIWIALVFAGLYYVAYILLRPVYYADYHGGQLGDNYLFVHHTLEDPKFYFIHHVYFPFVPGQIWQALVRWSVVSSQSSDYLEKAFTFFSLPNRLAAGLLLVITYRTLRRLGWERVVAYLSTAWIAVSFGFAYWPLQSTGLGLVVPFTLLSVLLSFLAVKESRPHYFFLAGLTTALCMYIHGSSLFVCAGLAIALTLILLQKSWNAKSWRPIVPLFWFALPAVLLAAALYLFIVNHFNTRDIHTLLSLTSDYEHFGKFTLNSTFLTRTLQDGLSASAAMTLGLLQGGIHRPVEWAACFLQLSAISFLLSSLRRLSWGSLVHDEAYATHRFIVFAVAASVLGYGTRTMWLQYYAAYAPLAAMAIVLLGFGAPRDHARQRVFVIPLLLLSLGTHYINAYSHVRVHSGERVTDHVVYRRLALISQAFPNRPVLYMIPDEREPYNVVRILAYYELSGPFKMIRFRPPVPAKELNKVIKENPDRVVMVNQADYPDLKKHLGQNIDVKEFSSADFPGGMAYALSTQRV